MKSVVSVSNCKVDFNVQEIVEAMMASIEHIGGWPPKILLAKKVFIKVNLLSFFHTSRNERNRLHRGRPVASTDPMVVEALVILLQKINPMIQIIVGEGIDKTLDESAEQIWNVAGYTKIQEKYGVKLVDINLSPCQRVECQDLQGMHRKYWVNNDLISSDVRITIGKLKLHGTASFTMSLKNMFGCIPNKFYGNGDRGMLHGNPIRLLRSVVDIARIISPDLSIIDGIVGCDGNFIGEPVEVECLVLGTHCVSTDAVGAMLMGIDPEGDFPQHPFLSSENYLKVAAKLGLGTFIPNEIDVRGIKLQSLCKKFILKRMRPYPTEEISRWVYLASSSAQFFMQNREKFEDEFINQWVYIYDKKVIWTASSLQEAAHKIRLSHREKLWGFDMFVCSLNEQNEILERYTEALQGETAYSCAYMG